MSVRNLNWYFDYYLIESKQIMFILYEARTKGMYVTRDVFRIIPKANSHKPQSVVNKTTISSFIIIQSTNKIHNI